MYLFLPFSSFQVQLAKLNQCGSERLKAGVDVDSDIFDELVRTSNASFKVLVGDKSGKKLKQHSVMFT